MSVDDVFADPLHTSADAAAVPRGPRWRALPALLAAACVIAVATVAVLARAGGHGAVTGAPNEVSCPSSYPAAADMAAHSVGSDASQRLVPIEPPRSAVVCAYLGGGRGLSGTRTVSDGLSRLASELTWEPPAPPAGSWCATYAATTDGDNYLLLLDYGHATQCGCRCRQSLRGEHQRTVHDRHQSP